MNTKPLIGIISASHLSGGIIQKFSTSEYYVKAAAAAGAMPVLIPFTSEMSTEDIDRYIDALDGFIFPGGGDFDSSWFGEEMLPGLEPSEYDMEFQVNAVYMAKKAVLSNKPVVGICLGMQLLNIAFGGSLYQDIPMQVKSNIRHSNKVTVPEDRWKEVHSVKLEKDCLLRKISCCGSEEDEGILMVNSFHHQAVKDVAAGFKAAAVAEDGIIEAIEYENGKVIGTQWHPENLAYAQVPHAKALFSWLIEETRISSEKLK